MDNNIPKDIPNEAAIPNPALQSMDALVGEWKTLGKHRLFPNLPLHGHVSLSWIKGGAFMMMQTEVEEVGFPSAISIFGSDDASEEYTMLYFDERGVSRKFQGTLSGKVWKYWRDAPGFSQRFTGTISDDGDTITWVSELAEADSTWKRDMEVTFTRIK